MFYFCVSKRILDFQITGGNLPFRDLEMFYPPKWAAKAVPKVVQLLLLMFSIWEPNKRSVFPTGVHLILLYFIRISLLTPKIIVLLWCGCGCGWRTFFVFKSLDNNMVYSLGIYYSSTYTISMKKIEDKKSAPHPPLNKTKISGVKSEIRIKYKRIKWTPSGKASLLSSQGDRINWTPM